MMRPWARPVISCAVLLGVYFVVPLRRGGLSPADFVVRVLVTVGGFVLVLVIVGRQVRRALADQRRLAERVGSLLVIVTLVVVFFASVYYVLQGQFHGMSTRVDTLYFTVVTLCTVGFGDMVPVSQTARAIVTVQMLFDLVIVTSALSVVVGAVRPTASRRGR
jgi:voltage-gated potassium channel